MCKNSDVESCLFSTAIDLGIAGKDINFGHGLLQADEAYLCLRDQVQCCTEASSSSSTAPSPSPTSLYKELATSPVLAVNATTGEEMKQVSVNNLHTSKKRLRKLTFFCSHVRPCSGSRTTRQTIPQVLWMIRHSPNICRQS